MIIPLIAGILFGILAGLFPGLHSNTIAQMLKEVSTGSLDLAIAVVAATAVNNIIALIPAIYLFVPEQETVLSVLPGQRLVQKGLGRYAIWTCGMAAVLTLLFLIPLLFLSFNFLQSVYSLIRPFLAPLLVLISAIFILQEHKRGAHGVAKAAAVFIACGLFGVLVLNSSLFKEPLFPVFTGFFALSNIILSSSNISLPRQIRWKEDGVSKKMLSSLVTVVFFGAVLGVAADLLPALGSPAQLATFGSPLVAGSPSLFIAMTTSITVGHSANSLVAIETIGKTRTGAAAFVSELVGPPSTDVTIILLIVFFVSTAVAVMLLSPLSELFMRSIGRINLQMMNALLFLYLSAAIFYVSGPFGIVAAAVSTALGLVPPLIGVRRTHLMGFLILPTILLLL